MPRTFKRWFVRASGEAYLYFVYSRTSVVHVRCWVFQSKVRLLEIFLGSNWFSCIWSWRDLGFKSLGWQRRLQVYLPGWLMYYPLSYFHWSLCTTRLWGFLISAKTCPLPIHLLVNLDYRCSPQSFPETSYGCNCQSNVDYNYTLDWDKKKRFMLVVKFIAAQTYIFNFSLQHGFYL